MLLRRASFLLVCLPLIAACAHAPAASDDGPALPEARVVEIQVDPEGRFGLMLGLSREEVTRLMRKQGFRIKGDAEDPRNALRPVEFFVDDHRYFEEIAALHREEGVVALWSADYVSLGFRSGQLAMIFDGPTAAMPVAETRRAFADMDRAFSGRCGPSFEYRLPHRFREETIGGVDVFQEKHWNCGRYWVQLYETEDPMNTDPGVSKVVVIYYDPEAFGFE